MTKKWPRTRGAHDIHAENRRRAVARLLSNFQNSKDGLLVFLCRLGVRHKWCGFKEIHGFYFCAARLRVVFASCARALNGASTAARSAVRAPKIVQIGSV